MFIYKWGTHQKVFISSKKTSFWNTNLEREHMEKIKKDKWGILIQKFLNQVVANLYQALFKKWNKIQRHHWPHWNQEQSYWQSIRVYVKVANIYPPKRYRSGFSKVLLTSNFLRFTLSSLVLTNRHVRIPTVRRVCQRKQMKGLHSHW